MAKILLNRLLEQNPSKRYTADKILRHPWVTRRKYDNIPKTYLEIFKIGSLRKKLSQVYRYI